jgi:hypothetical protein
LQPTPTSFYLCEWKIAGGTNDLPWPGSGRWTGLVPDQTTFARLGTTPNRQFGTSGRQADRSTTARGYGIRFGHSGASRDRPTPSSVSQDPIKTPRGGLRTQSERIRGPKSSKYLPIYPLSEMSKPRS